MSNNFNEFIEDQKIRYKKNVANHKNDYNNYLDDIGDDKAQDTYYNVKQAFVNKKTGSRNLTDERKFFEEKNFEITNNQVKIVYNAFNDKKKSKVETSINDANGGAGYDISIPINTINLGVLFRQEVQVFPVQPRFTFRDGKYQLDPFDYTRQTELDIDTIIPDAQREITIQREGYFVDNVRYNEVAPFNMDEEDYISEAKDDVSQNRREVNYGNYTTKYAPLNKYLKTISRNRFKEAHFIANTNWACQNDYGNQLLNTALEIEYTQEKVQKTNFYLKQLLLGNHISIAPAQQSGSSTAAGKIAHKLFYSATKSKNIRLSKMTDKEFLDKLDEWASVLICSDSGFVNPYRMPTLFLSAQEAKTLAGQKIKATTTSGTGIYNNLYVGNNRLEALYDSCKKNNSNFAIVVLDDANSLSANTYTKLRSLSPASFSGVVDSCFLLDMSLTCATTIIRDGCFARGGFNTNINQILNDENYVLNSPLDMDITIISTFTNLLLASLRFRDDNNDLMIRFDFDE